MAQIGRDWITSTERRAFELRVVRGLTPINWCAQQAAQLLLRAVDGEWQPLVHVERALVPGQTYYAEKIGRGQDGGRAAALLDTLMIDEIPHFTAIKAGSASLVGPRGVRPAHRANLFEAIGHHAEQWQEILGLQKPGILSSYAITAHHGGETVPADDDSKTEEEIVVEARERFNSDLYDFESASKQHDLYLMRHFASMVLSRATGGRTGSTHYGTYKTAS